MRRIFQLVVVLLWLSLIKGFAQTTLPLFFSDSMVLQRETQVNIWGNDIANKNITVSGSWGNSSTIKSDTQGKWKLKLQTPIAGGPYTVTVAGSSTITLKGVLIGEVWFCAGQSNMEMPMKGYLSTSPPQLVDSSNYFIANSRNSNIRYFKSSWNPVSRTPLETLKVPGSWESATPESTPDWSAIAYFFGKKLQDELGVPIGLLYTARGGSSIESWMDSATLSTVKPVVLPTNLDWQMAHSTPTMMYNTFLHPYIGYSIKGMIWSQGEANRQNNSEYLELFTKTINSWRTQWGIGKFPFYFTEIAPRGGTADVNSALIREAQLSTMLTVDSTGMASTMDIGNQLNDHYPKKRIIGDRLALWALIRNYNRSGIPSGPIYKSHTISSNFIKLKFHYTGDGLTSFGNTLTDFEIAGSNKVFVAATATITDNNTSVNVSSSSVSQPKFVRYGFKNAVIGTLFNSNGFPAPSFRTEQIIILLPVSFGDITVNNINNNRQIAWNVFQEINIDSYEVQVSLNGIYFTTIKKIYPKGNNQHYNYLDASQLSAAYLYYRIKVNNTNGNIEYSTIVKYSTPLTSTFTIVSSVNNMLKLFATHAFTGNIIVVNSIGQLVVQKQINGQVGSIQIQLPPNNKGLLFVKIVTNNQHITKQIVLF